MGCSVEMEVADGGAGKEDGERDVVVEREDVDVAGLAGVEVSLEREGVARREW